MHPFNILNEWKCMFQLKLRTVKKYCLLYVSYSYINLFQVTVKYFKFKRTNYSIVSTFIIMSMA